MRGNKRRVKGLPGALYMKRKEENWVTEWSDKICGGAAWPHGQQVKEEIGAGRGGDKRGKQVLQKRHHLIRRNNI